jgi:hypothetical protein
MPRISKTKKDKISEQILYYLFQSFPKQLFTADIAREIARDEEFIKVMMHDLLKKELVIKVDKNSQGIIYSRRARWRLSNKAQEAYSKQVNQKTTQTQVFEAENKEN